MRNPPAATGGLSRQPLQGYQWGTHMVPCGGFSHAEDLVPKKRVRVVSHGPGERKTETTPAPQGWQHQGGPPRGGGKGDPGTRQPQHQPQVPKIQSWIADADTAARTTNHQPSGGMSGSSAPSSPNTAVL